MSESRAACEVWARMEMAVNGWEMCCITLWFYSHTFIRLHYLTYLLSHFTLCVCLQLPHEPSASAREFLVNFSINAC